MNECLFYRISLEIFALFPIKISFLNIRGVFLSFYNKTIIYYEKIPLNLNSNNIRQI